MYLEKITLSTTRPCLAEPGKIIVVGKPARELSEVLPYLANLPGVIGYNPQAQNLTFRRQPGFMTLYAEEVVFTQVTDTEEGLVLFEALVEAINSTWEKKDELVAVESAKQPAKPLDIYALLPQTNCKACGEATCMAFAAKLFMGEQLLGACTPLFDDPGFGERKIALEGLL